MVSHLSGPQTETIMVFGSKNHHLESGILEGFHPLTAVKIGGIKHLGIFLTVTPLAVGKRIYAEVKKGGHLEVLPLKLTCIGYKP